MKGLRALFLWFLAAFVLIELALAIFTTLNGELDELVSGTMQATILVISGAASIALTIFFSVRGPLAAPEAPRLAHDQGCRQCAARDAKDYVTDYGWYEVVQANTVTSRAYVPLGQVRVHLCDRCAVREMQSRGSRARRLAWATILAGLPVLVGALAVLPLIADRDVLVLGWIVLLASGAAVAFGCIVFFGQGLIRLIYRVGGAKVRDNDLRSFAQAWSWKLASGPIRAQFLEGEEHTHDYVAKFWVGPKEAEVESWAPAERTVTPRYRATPETRP